MPNFVRLAQYAQAQLAAAGYSGSTPIPNSALTNLLHPLCITALRLTGVSTSNGTHTVVNWKAKPARPPRPPQNGSPDNP